MKRMNKNTEDFIKILENLKPGSFRELEIEINNISELIVEIESLRKEQINKYQMALENIEDDLGCIEGLSSQDDIGLIKELVDKMNEKDVRIVSKKYTTTQIGGACSNCGEVVLHNTNGNYCGNCGYKVRW